MYVYTINDFKPEALVVVPSKKTRTILCSRKQREDTFKVHSEIMSIFLFLNESSNESNGYIVID